MINIPKQYIETAIITTTSPKTAVHFHSITDQDKTIKAVERRLLPTRRQAQQSKPQIEQRVSSDRRHPAFSAKA